MRQMFGMRWEAEEGKTRSENGKEGIISEETIKIGLLECRGKNRRN